MSQIFSTGTLPKYSLFVLRHHSHLKQSQSFAGPALVVRTCEDCIFDIIGAEFVVVTQIQSVVAYCGTHIDQSRYLVPISLLVFPQMWPVGSHVLSASIVPLLGLPFQDASIALRVRKRHNFLSNANQSSLHPSRLGPLSSFAEGDYFSITLSGSSTAFIKSHVFFLFAFKPRSRQTWMVSAITI